MGNTEKTFEFGLLPNITTEDDIRFGDIVIWSYKKHSNEYLDADTKKILDNIVACYKNSRGDQLDDLTIISHVDDGKARSLNTKDSKINAKMAINLLAYQELRFAYESFIKFYDNFFFTLFEINPSKPSKGLKIYSRSGITIVQLRNYKVFAPNIGQYQIHYKTTNEFSRAMQNLYNNATSSRANKQIARIVRSIEWCNYSQVFEPLVTDHMSVISLAVAIEALLGIDNTDRTENKTLKNSAQLLLGESQSVAEWLTKFYVLRNEIVHGKEVDTHKLVYEGQTSHTVLARIVFDYLLIVRLDLLRLYPQDGFGNFEPIEYYLGSNKKRLKQINDINFKSLENEEQSEKLLNLGRLVNIETDHSADVALLKQTIRHLVDILDESLEYHLNLARDEANYRHIKDFAKRIKEYQDLVKKLKKGDTDNTQMLQIEQDLVSEDEFPMRIRFLEVNKNSIIKIDNLIYFIVRLDGLKYRLT